MTLAALIRGVRAADSAKSATATPATPATLEGARGRTVATVATVAVANAQEMAADVLTDPAGEARRQRVLAKLAKDWALLRAVECDGIAANNVVVITVAIRHLGEIITADIEVPAARYDPFLLIDLVQRHAGTVH